MEGGCRLRHLVSGRHLLWDPQDCTLTVSHQYATETAAWELLPYRGLGSGVEPGDHILLRAQHSEAWLLPEQPASPHTGGVALDRVAASCGAERCEQDSLEVSFAREDLLSLPWTPQISPDTSLPYVKRWPGCLG